MFNWFRHLRISLAAKCQLLFGAAVVLIIGAALSVPWIRMDGLVKETNLHTAEGLEQQAIQEHISVEEGETQLGRLTPPATRPTVGSLRSRSRSQQITASDFVWPRIVSALPPFPRNLSPFDRAALRFFRDPNQLHFPQTYHAPGGERYRLAMPLYDEPSCLRCHSNDTGLTHAPLRAGAAMPTTMPLVRKLLGIAVIDIPSQVNPNVLYLNRTLMLLSGAIAGTLAISVLYLITTRLILKPVRVLQETAEKVSEGDLDIRSDISTGDEFQQLSETFNTMLSNLKSSDEQLRASNKALDLKLGQLAETNVALYESNRLKSEFLANVSHELRTPLNSILGFAQLLQDATEKLGQESKPTRYLQNILTSGQNLLDLINDLLDLAKIEAGRMDVRSEPLSLGDVFEGLINLLKPIAESRDVSILPEVGVHVPIIHSDPAKLQQVLYNLLSNAIKFSPIGGRVRMTAHMQGEETVQINVSDTGPGIDPDKQDVIFEKFRQIDGSVTRAHSGTGLGLAIAKELTALLGGTIGVQSTPGKGATFWMTLPLKTQAGARDVRSKLVLS